MLLHFILLFVRSTLAIPTSPHRAVLRLECCCGIGAIVEAETPPDCEAETPPESDKDQFLNEVSITVRIKINKIF